MFSLADITTSLAGEIGKSPTPEIVSWTEPWWKMVRHAAEESKRLGMDFGCLMVPDMKQAGELDLSRKFDAGNLLVEADHNRNTHINLKLERPQVNPRSSHPFAAINHETLAEEIPVIEARKTYYKDIVVLAVPADGAVNPGDVIDLSGKMQSDGQISWDAPVGEWSIYRLGHTTTGALVFPPNGNLQLWNVIRCLRKRSIFT